MTATHDTEVRAARAREAQEDRILVDKALEGDRAAYGELVERYQKRVYSVAYGILRSREDAWDVAQEAFVKAYRNLDRFTGSSAFFTWIYRITYNLSIDHLRSSGRREHVSTDDPGFVERALEDGDQISTEGQPEEMSERAELMRVLHQAMSRLSEKHRAIIVLREVEGLSYEEIADVLGLAKGTVMSRLFHARKNLQALLKPYVEEGDDVPESLVLATSRS